MWFVYVIENESKRFHYVGMSENPDSRLKSHNSGKVKSTKYYRPFKIIYSEKVGERNEARKREKYLKSAGGKRYLKKLLGNFRGSLPD